MKRNIYILWGLTFFVVLLGCKNTSKSTEVSTEKEIHETDSFTVLTMDGEHKISIQEFVDRANNGDRIAQYTVGQMFLSGDGIEQSNEYAAEWFNKSAEQDYAPGQHMLGLCYYQGIGVKQSFSDAVKWYRKSAEQGYSYGQHCLGVCYLQGQGVRKSEREAFKWFMKAAQQGLAESQCNVADCYLKRSWGRFL